MTTEEQRDTRLLLMRAGERLFAERGVDAVSLREVSVAAEQHNHAAAQYHFGSKEGLLDAIILRHSAPIQQGWLSTLAHLEATRPPGLDALFQLMVRPIVDKLDDPDGGRDYLMLSAQLVTHPRYVLMERPTAIGPGALRLTEALFGHIALPPELLLLRMARVAGTLYQSIADYARRGDHTPAGRAVFTSDLVDTLVAIARAHPSRATRRHLESRPAAQRRRPR